jgi:hypothetical protein
VLRSSSQYSRADDVAVPVSQYSVMLSRILVQHPGRQPDGGIRQGEADRLGVLGHLDDVAPLPEGGEGIECSGFLLLGVAARTATASRLKSPSGTGPPPKTAASTSVGKALRRLRWMPSSPFGAWRAIASVTEAPWAT